jgi:hypothetical protein
MSSQYQIEINRTNAQRSTGPRTTLGKERSRWNALKHGARAESLVLPGEDPAALEQEIDAWVAAIGPSNHIEQRLAETAAKAYWQGQRIERAQVARLETSMLRAPATEQDQEQDEVLALGDRLLFDRVGPAQRYPTERLHGTAPYTSVAQQPGDPDLPCRLVNRLESTAAGCRWLLDRWNEVGEVLRPGNAWRSQDRFRVARLLGKQPMDAVWDPGLRSIYIACDVIFSAPGGPFSDLYKEMLPDEAKAFRRNLEAQARAEYRPPDGREALRVLTDVVRGPTARLRAILAEHERIAELAQAQPRDRKAFDASHEGELQRRYETSSDRKLHRALREIAKLRKDGTFALGGNARGGAGGGVSLEDGTATEAAPAADSATTTTDGSTVDCNESDDPASWSALESEANDRELSHQGPRTKDQGLEPAVLPNEPNAASTDCDEIDDPESGSVTRSAGSDREVAQGSPSLRDGTENEASLGDAVPAAERRATLEPGDASLGEAVPAAERRSTLDEEAVTSKVDCLRPISREFLDEARLPAHDGGGPRSDQAGDDSRE